MMRTQDSHNLPSFSSLRPLLVLICLLLFAAQSVSGQEACPPPPNYAENPLSAPSITAAEVAANPTADNLRMFALAARDYLYRNVGCQRPVANRARLLPLSPGGQVIGAPAASSPSPCPFNPEIARQPPGSHQHAGGPSCEAAWRSGAGSSIVRLPEPSCLQPRMISIEPEAWPAAALCRDWAATPCFLARSSCSSASTCKNLTWIREIIDSHYIPQVTASEVVDRASLKVFVNEAIDYFGQLERDVAALTLPKWQGAFSETGTDLG